MRDGRDLVYAGLLLLFVGVMVSASTRAASPAALSGHGAPIVSYPARFAISPPLSEVNGSSREDGRTVKYVAVRVEQELRDLIDYTPQQIGIMSADGRRLYANRFALDYAGITLKEYQSSGYMRRFAHPDDLETIRQRGPILAKLTSLKSGCAAGTEFTDGTSFGPSHSATATNESFGGIPPGRKSRTASWPNKGYRMRTWLCVKKSTKCRCSKQSWATPLLCKRRSLAWPKLLPPNHRF